MRKLVTERFELLSRLSGLDFGYIWENGTWVFLRQILISLFAILVAFVFTHFGTKEDFGAYNLILSIFAVASVFSLPGVATSVIQSTASGFDRSYLEGLKLRFSFSIIGVPLLLVLGYYYSLNASESLSISIIFASLVFPFLNTFSTYDSLLSGKRLFKVHSILAMIISGVVSLGVITAVLTRLNVVYAILIYFGLTTILNFSAHLFSLRYLGRNPGRDHDFKKYSYFMSFISGVSLAASNLDKIILGSLAGFSTLAVYSAALVVPDGIAKNLKTFMGIYTVKLAGKSQAENKKVLASFYWKLIAIGAFLTIGLWMVLPKFITLFFSEKYTESIIFAQLLSLVLLFSPLVTALSSAIIFEKRYQDTIIFNAVPQLLKTLLYIVFIPTFGILGVVISLLTEKFISAALLTYLIFKK